jgi:hypothetical protein
MSSARIPLAWTATYHNPPLQLASAIATAAISNASLRRLPAYHHAAWAGYYGRSTRDRSSWFIDLYKVRDLFVKLYRRQKVVRERLGISADDWSFFETTLNTNDLRHAELTGVLPTLNEQDVTRLYALARDWIKSHLRVLGLATV